jgi:hypothetical protein
MSEEGAGSEKKQSQIDMRLRREWYRAAGLSEDEISELLRETTTPPKTQVLIVPK